MIRVVAAIAVLGAASATVLASRTSEVSGIVIAAATGSAIRGATVRLVSTDAREVTIATETDDAGRFQFDRLAAGQYHLTASHQGFLDVEYGQKRPGSGAPGVAIRVTEGQRVESMVVAMPRGGAISGVVLDAHGDPAFKASVTAARYVWESGVQTVVEVDTELSDDLGRYRIPLLPPGEYIVKVSPSESETMTAPVYFPGVAFLSAATPIMLAVAEERSGVDVALQQLPAVRIGGVIVDVDGRPPSRPLMIALTDAATGAAAAGMSTQVIEGRFAFSGLAPGRYVVTVIAGSGVQIWNADAASRESDRQDDGPVRSAQVEVTLDDHDVSDLRLTLQPGGSVSGRVVVDAPASPVDWSTMRIRIVPIGSIPIWRPTPVSPIDARGHFSISGVPPGLHQLTLEGGGGWMLRSAIVDGRDALDFPFDIRPAGGTTGVVLTLTDRTTELTGRLLDRNGEPACDFNVVVFAADSRYWTPGSRRMATVRPASDGRFTFRGLPQDEYRLAVLDDVEPGRWSDPRLLRVLTGSSIVVRLIEGEARNQDIRLR